jgi:ligand-binding SRPBCC domain-containing protein
MNFESSFELCAPLESVREFHARAASLAALTPPLMPMRLDASPSALQSGDTMSFHVWLGPFPIRWTAHIERAGPGGFTDRQTEGPFAAWVHLHAFEPISSGTTRVVDTITARLRPHLVWGPVGLMMWIGLPWLFTYRRWMTRRILERA